MFQCSELLQIDQQSCQDTSTHQGWAGSSFAWTGFQVRQFLPASWDHEVHNWKDRRIRCCISRHHKEKKHMSSDTDQTSQHWQSFRQKIRWFDFRQGHWFPWRMHLPTFTRMQRDVILHWRKKKRKPLCTHSGMRTHGFDILSATLEVLVAFPHSQGLFNQLPQPQEELIQTLKNIRFEKGRWALGPLGPTALSQSLKLRTANIVWKIVR